MTSETFQRTEIQTKKNRITIDTRFVSYCGWETCMFTAGLNSEVKENYANEREAIIGHFKWCLKVAEAKGDYNIHK